MKFLSSQFAFFLGDRKMRTNLHALRKYLILLVVVIVVFSVGFHVIMSKVEGQEYSWLTGFYWTMTVMSTLGFGDITFKTDIGRMFSIVVLLSGMVLLLIVLPFAFIRFLYAPWLESRLRQQAPRSVDDTIRGHVIICRNDSITPGLIQKLVQNRIPYYVIEPDPLVAVQMMADGISVVTGEIESKATYEQLRVEHARMVFANGEDTLNTNITLTVREVNPAVPVVALVEQEDSIDILELSGATHVLQLKQRLGEQLASRISAGVGSAHIVGRFKNLQIAEFVVHETDLAGKTLAESRLRELTGVNVVGLWERGKLKPLSEDTRFSRFTVPVAIGTREQIEKLNGLIAASNGAENPVLIIGAGRVGRAAAAAMELRGVPVHIVEQNGALAKDLADVVQKFVVGNAADRDVLLEAGLESASAVALTTNDDAMNVYLTVYCRRLQPQINIVSRVTHERNVEAIFRAGADSVLSYATLGREYVMSRLFEGDPMMLGEGADFFFVDTPPSVAGKTLAASSVGAKSGLIIVAVEGAGDALTNPSADTVLPTRGRLLMIGTAEQRQLFAEHFEK